LQSHVIVNVSHPNNQLDTHPYLINFLNGTYDVMQARLRAHDRKDLFTKLIPYPYHVDAKADRFRQFITEIFPDNKPLQKYVQQMAGYFFTGDQSNKCFMYFWGNDGDNGKTLLSDVLLKAAGEYGYPAPISLILETKHQQHPVDTACLRGMRFVTISETKEDAKLNEGRIKNFTGDGLLNGRWMHQNPFFFEQTHHFCFDSNYKLHITGRDPAIWDRPKLIEFEVRFVDAVPATEDCPEPTQPKHMKDRGLKEKLFAEIEGVIAWVIEGANGWYARKKQGLGIEEPRCVTQAVEEYQKEESVLQHLIDEIITITDKPEDEISKDRMYAASRVWFRLQGMSPWSKNKLGRLLKFEDGSRDSQRFWKGITFQSAEWISRADAEIQSLKEGKVGPRDANNND
jgi:putative DNA primase/helicase